MITKLLSILISLALAIAAMEAFLFLVPSFQGAHAPVARVFCEGGPDYARPSARFGTIEAPNAVFFERQNEADGWTLHFVNDMGFRDLYDDGEVGAVVLGDSFARGTLVSNHETFAGLLDRWQPDVTFHNFGIGGFGTADAYRVYQEIADETPHRLVVLAYYVGNDVDNNLESAYALEDGQLVYHEPEDAAGQDDQKKSLLLQAHIFFWHQLRSYRLVHETLQRQLAGMAVSSAEADTSFAAGEALTEALLTELADTAAGHDADLLIAILPDWNEALDAGAAARADRQRAMIQDLAQSSAHVSTVDLAVTMADWPREELYGQLDKHFSRLGQYATAAAITDWLKDDWSSTGIEIKPAPAYDPDPEVEILPDCALVAAYRDRFLTPPAR